MQDLLKQKAEDVIPKKIVCEHSRAFFSKKLSDLHKEFRIAKKRFDFRSDEHNQNKLDQAKDKLNAEYEKESDNFWKEICQNTSSRDIWNTIKKITNQQKHIILQPLRNSDGSFEFGDENIASRLKSAHVVKDNIDTSRFDDAWFHKVNSEVDRFLTEERDAAIQNLESGNALQEVYNRDITPSEVENAIDSLKTNSSPGPDNVLPIMVKKAKDALVPILTDIFQCCWHEGSVPSIWKEDHRVFIPKPDIDPHIEKALRALSLTPIIGKSFERIVTNRLVWWLETNFQIPDNLFAYRKCRGVVQALLTLICNIRKGFANNEYTVAAMVDLHAAFDTVWRKGIMHKLYNMGIRGRLLLYVESFLTGRRSKLLVNTYQSPWIDTTIGVPQGAIIAPILFTVYIADMTQNISSSIGFADDLTMWITHVCPQIASGLLENDLDELNVWTRKWRLVINKTKTEVMCFTKSRAVQVTVKLDNISLAQVETKKCLGVNLDSKLSFTKHVENTRTKALKTLSSVSRLLNETGGMRSALGLMLYNSLVFPILTYAYPVWSTISNTQLSLLEDVHEAALRKITGTHGGTATNSLEVILGVLPFRLQLQDIMAKEYIRILRKNPDSATRNIIQQCLDSTSTASNPAKLMKQAIRETERIIDLEKLDPEPGYSEDRAVVEIRKRYLEKWKDLGSSKNRTSAQKLLTANSIQEHLSGIQRTTLAIFTDGSALGNPGPCGCSAIIFTNGLTHDAITIKRPVARHSTSFHGEIAAIDLALEYTAHATLPGCSTVLIHSDCQAAIESVCNNSSNHTTLIKSIVSNIRTLSDRGIAVEFCWIPGHAGIAANDLADAAAKSAAEEAQALTSEQDESETTMESAKKQLKLELVKIWQRQWDMQTEGRYTHNILPVVKLNRLKNVQHGKVLRQADARLNRLLSGNTLLKAHRLSQAINRRAGTDASTQCECGRAPQDAEHYLLECPLSVFRR